MSIHGIINLFQQNFVENSPIDLAHTRLSHSFIQQVTEDWVRKQFEAGAAITRNAVQEKGLSVASIRKASETFQPTDAWADAILKKFAPSQLTESPMHTDSEDSAGAPQSSKEKQTDKKSSEEKSTGGGRKGRKGKMIDATLIKPAVPSIHATNDETRSSTSPNFFEATQPDPSIEKKRILRPVRKPKRRIQPPNIREPEDPPLDLSTPDTGKVSNTGILETSKPKGKKVKALKNPPVAEKEERVIRSNSPDMVDVTDSKSVAAKRKKTNLSVDLGKSRPVSLDVLPPKRKKVVKKTVPKDTIADVHIDEISKSMVVQMKKKKMDAAEAEVITPVTTRAKKKGGQSIQKAVKGAAKKPNAKDGGSSSMSSAVLDPDDDLLIQQEKTFNVRATRSKGKLEPEALQVQPISKSKKPLASKSTRTQKKKKTGVETAATSTIQNVNNEDLPIVKEVVSALPIEEEAHRESLEMATLVQESMDESLEKSRRESEIPVLEVEEIPLDCSKKLPLTSSSLPGTSFVSHLERAEESEQIRDNRKEMEDPMSPVVEMDCEKTSDAAKMYSMLKRSSTETEDEDTTSNDSEITVISPNGTPFQKINESRTSINDHTLPPSPPPDNEVDPGKNIVPDSDSSSHEDEETEFDTSVHMTSVDHVEDVDLSSNDINVEDDESSEDDHAVENKVEEEHDETDSSQSSESEEDDTENDSEEGENNEALKEFNPITRPFQLPKSFDFSKLAEATATSATADVELASQDLFASQPLIPSTFFFVAPSSLTNIQSNEVENGAEEDRGNVPEQEVPVIDITYESLSSTQFTLEENAVINEHANEETEKKGILKRKMDDKIASAEQPPLKKSKNVQFAPLPTRSPEHEERLRNKESTSAFQRRTHKIPSNRPGCAHLRNTKRRKATRITHSLKSVSNVFFPETESRSNVFKIPHAPLAKKGNAQRVAAKPSSSLDTSTLADESDNSTKTDGAEKNKSQGMIPSLQQHLSEGSEKGPSSLPPVVNNDESASFSELDLSNVVDEAGVFVSSQSFSEPAAILQVAYPPLSACQHDVHFVLNELSTSASVDLLLLGLKERNVETVGDLCSLRVWHIQKLPIHPSPRLVTFRRVMKKYAEEIGLEDPVSFNSNGAGGQREEFSDIVIAGRGVEAMESEQSNPHLLTSGHIISADKQKGSSVLPNEECEPSQPQKMDSPTSARIPSSSLKSPSGSKSVPCQFNRSHFTSLQDFNVDTLSHLQNEPKNVIEDCERESEKEKESPALPEYINSLECGDEDKSSTSQEMFNSQDLRESDDEANGSISSTSNTRTSSIKPKSTSCPSSPFSQGRNSSQLLFNDLGFLSKLKKFIKVDSEDADRFVEYIATDKTCTRKYFKSVLADEELSKDILLRPPPEGISLPQGILAGALVTSVVHGSRTEGLGLGGENGSFSKGVHAMVQGLHQQYKVKVQEGPQKLKEWIDDSFKPFLETKKNRTLDEIVKDAHIIVDEMMEIERSENAEGKDLNAGGFLNDEQGEKEETILKFVKCVMGTKLSRSGRHSCAKYLLDSLMDG